MNHRGCSCKSGTDEGTDECTAVKDKGGLEVDDVLEVKEGNLADVGQEVEGMTMGMLVSVREVGVEPGKGSAGYVKGVLKASEKDGLVDDVLG